MNKEIKLVIKENEYLVKFPNVGQLSDIEVLKGSISRGLYGAMQSNSTIDSGFALDLVDMEAYFTILCPQLIKDLKVDSFRELDLTDAIDLREVFVDQLLPFIKQWRDIIAEIGKEKKSDDK
jgi:hypothetical protein